jgi:hypothetical protein
MGGERLEQPVQLEVRAFVKDDKIQVRHGDFTFVQAVLNCLRGKAFISLPARESFFLGGGDDLAVTDQARSGIMKEGGDAQNIRRFPHVKRSLDA